jgi:rhodanese-related sulfurtransferase
MSKLFKFIVASIIAIFAFGSLTACSTAEPVDLSTVAAVIDVRTPEEISSGYLEGALKFDFQGPNFASEIATLDKSKDYVIYCRSGNRAGGAINFMKQNGFTGTLTNAGSLDEAASATGLPVVR